MQNSLIIGTGSYLPPNIVTNFDLEKQFDTSNEWIVSRTGIKQRHIVENESTCDLAEQAALNALKSANLKANEIDLIIVATTTADKIFPSTACLLQNRLGITNSCPAFDVQAVCTGFIYALSIADKFIKQNSAKNALIIGAETMSKIVNWQDRSTSVLFGDGAGAVVLQACDDSNRGILSTKLHADGRYHDLLHTPGGISLGLSHESDTVLQMKGNEVFKMAVNTLGKIAETTLSASNFTNSDIDWLVPHQANNRIIMATARKLKIAMEKVVITVDLHGNTSAASVPLALDCAVSDGRIKPGQNILLEAFGGGFTWGAALINM